ncbi:hypothetical protein C8024_01800 [Sphingopyxis sp. BSNA05]|uniref:hypothetical protein n=1 Tax=Sphingopyxis sp. BSNA05 TaxID=1236614 RepID=UPI001567BCC2|nr:hypothetical protein [Sphingopyxis sp. BSNA05]NRD88464.1 hypothetical protein [Sphingopyxis sp. BSNA05]
MKRVRRIGWVLLGLAFVLTSIAVGIRYTVGGDTADIITAGGVSAFSLGFILWMISSVTRLAKGDVRLRPWNALKLMPAYFAAFAALRFGAWAIFSEMEYNFADTLIHSIVPALVLSFYSTAYRSPT